MSVKNIPPQYTLNKVKRNNHSSFKYVQATFQAAASNSKKGPKHQIEPLHITCIIEKKEK